MVFHILYINERVGQNLGIYDTAIENTRKQEKVNKTAIEGASQHNSMPVPSPDKWRSKPQKGLSPLKRGLCLLLFLFLLLLTFVLIHA